MKMWIDKKRRCEDGVTTFIIKLKSQGSKIEDLMV